mmetsp:Transcript_1794/g.2347  ORF Transcript_1794/g.2347 Transcript_1794/m.2347 type:complete len:105 (-) Transcript_1794:52-366(-)
MIAQVYAISQVLFLNVDYLRGEFKWGLNGTVFFNLYLLSVLLIFVQGLVAIVMIPWFIISAFFILPAVVLYEVIFKGVTLEEATLEYEIVNEYESFDFEEYEEW